MPCLPISRDRPFDHACMAALAQNAPFNPSGSDLPVMLTMRPHLRAIIWSSRRCVSWRWRVKLSVMASVQSSSDASTLKLRLPPALLTMMSMPPSLASAVVSDFLRARRPPGSPARSSAGCGPPLAVISAATSSSRLPRRATSASCTPSAPSASAMPRPMPMLAPVTSAFLPLIFKSIGLSAAISIRRARRLRRRPRPAGRTNSGLMSISLRRGAECGRHARNVDQHRARAPPCRPPARRDSRRTAWRRAVRAIMSCAVSISNGAMRNVTSFRTSLKHAAEAQDDRRARSPRR